MFQGCTKIKLSSTKTGEYTQEYRISITGADTTASPLKDMFVSTGGTFTGTPEINTTYYLSTDNMIVRDTEGATLNGYVGSMIETAECIIPSSTPDSTKKFKITVDDDYNVSATNTSDSVSKTLATTEYVDNKFSTKTTSVTLAADSWTTSGNEFKYTYSNTSLRASASPIITCISNTSEYNYITDAEATANTGITFTAKIKPSNNIILQIIDLG